MWGYETVPLVSETMNDLPWLDLLDRSSVGTLVAEVEGATKANTC